jgi:hypothetical protein
MKRQDQLSSRVHRPLSAIALLLSAGLVIYPLIQMIKGASYFEPLNYIDNTTLLMIGLLILRGVTAGRKDPDLQAVSLALISSLSFVFTFESIYKFSFYWNPLKMPPDELRSLVVQMATSGTILAGCAFGKLRWSRLSWGFALLFALGWAFWILIGYPQIFNPRPQLFPLIQIPSSRAGIYFLNRALKFDLFLLFFSFYPGRNQASRPTP